MITKVGISRPDKLRFSRTGGYTDVDAVFDGINVIVYYGKQIKMVSTANAVIGRPLTPMSNAGVARRTTRRAVAVGAATYGTRCVQTVDAYGRTSIH